MISNENAIVKNIVEAIEGDFDTTFIHGGSQRNLRRLQKLATHIRNLRMILHCDAVVLSSPLVFCFFEALWCWLCRKPLILLVWDYYPVTIDGVRFNRSPRRIVLDVMEQLVVLMATKLIVPTTDFQAIHSLAQSVVVPMWYKKLPVVAGEMTGVPGNNSQGKSDRIVKIIFAGQINRTRALDLCLAHLDSIISEETVVYVASQDVFCAGEYESLTVKNMGFLAERELSALTKSCDFGLVSLHPNFDGPALPSKTFDYIAAGKPILYFGKDLPFYTQLLSRFAIGIDFSNLHHLDLSSIELDGADFALRQRGFQSALALDKKKFVTEVLKTISCSDSSAGRDSRNG